MMKFYVLLQSNQILMKKILQPEYIFESSWEVCNMVGGIYTVLSTRAATLQSTLGDKLIFIGPDVWYGKKNPLFEEDPDLFPEWIKYTSDNFNLSIRTGRWKVPGNPVAVLVDFHYLMMKKNEIYGKIWETSGVNSMSAYGDYDESSMFGYASGMIIESFFRFFKLTKKQQVIAHFNEWMTTFGLFYVREKLPSVATVFTTHATSIGRSIAGNHKPLYDYLEEYNGDQMAYELNMVSKHSTEKQAAHLADCFTTVSKITAVECTQLLDKEPDVVTPNGFEDDFVPKGKAFNTLRTAAREKLQKVAEKLIGENLQDDALFVGTAGRYEFKNKGIDVFIESLKHLNDMHDAKKQVVAFIMVPAWTKKHREDLACCLYHGDCKLPTENKTTTHELHDYYNDPVMGCLHWFHLRNHAADRVKVIFVPAYLNGDDGIFNQQYYNLLIGLDLTVFPSYYEPWGYTPLESVAFHVPTITTDLSGFGEWVSDIPLDISHGVGIVHRSDYNGWEVAFKIAEMIQKMSGYSPSTVTGVRKKAADIAEKALWKHFIQYYEEAYDIALRKKNTRLK
jgi:hypothetical protein